MEKKKLAVLISISALFVVGLFVLIQISPFSFMAKREESNTSYNTSNTGGADAVSSGGLTGGSVDNSQNILQDNTAGNDGDSNGIGDNINNISFDSISKKGKYCNSLITVDRATGNMTFNRPEQKGNIAAKEDGVWTIFVYMCGSNLESDEGAATDDLIEMTDATKSEKVRFIVETGGVKKWNNDLIKKNKIQRYLVQNGDIFLKDEKKYSNMSDSHTLANFLEWGVKKYSSEKMGVVMWNHGGGSVAGVCFDEKK